MFLTPGQNLQHDKEVNNYFLESLVRPDQNLFDQYIFPTSTYPLEDSSELQRFDPER